ncbi:MAG: class I adenylate cyclase [Methylobacter sp.]|jgi:adenylate cyclase class 1|nr:class I adenylate cyclase [Methylobacter sp.]
MTRSHQEPPIHLGSPGEEISIQDLQSIKHRFKRLSQLREQRIQKSLHPRQRVFSELLPLLFHGNFTMLPGFISPETPAGIPEYNPGDQTLNTARQLASTFNYTRTASLSYPIEGLFLMGSVGSIAVSKNNDMDIWVCHQSDLSPDAINGLQQKASAIETWAESLELEVHFCLIDSKQFRLGQHTPMSTESSGQTQHHLLLEEFYRTAIYIAGKSPAWWLVPPHEEGNYTRYINHLITNRFIPEHELIDFGGLEAVPADEFASATLWHIYKALHAPYKSLLELLLMESYASEYPQTEWLCHDIKKAVYQGNFMTTDLDPYLLIYTKVERYLQNAHNQERLDFARQSFYLKVMGPSDTTLDAPTRISKERYIYQIAKIWKWPASTIDEAKQVLSWNIQKATEEHAVIVRQLTHCYRMIMGFAKDHVTPNQESNNDLKLIGRKLHSFLEKKPGKVEIITTHADVHSKENALSIVENTLAAKIEGWALYPKYVQMTTATEFEPIQKCRTLIETLCWLVINGLYHKHLLINFSSHSLKMPDSELRSVLRQINLFLSHNFTFDAPLDAYKTPKIPLHSLIFINMGIADNERLCVMSERRSDPLSYGIDRQCFIQTISRISLSSWSEITTSHEDGLDGLFTCLTDVINNNQKPLSLKNVKFVCHMPNRARDIIFRVEILFSILVKLFSAPQQNHSPRYILPGGTAFYVFQSINKTLSYKMLATEKLLLDEIGRPQKQFSSIHFDQAILENTPVRLIYSMNKPQVIQLFYYDNKTGISVYIVDEKGSLYTQQHNKTNVSHLLKHYAAFLESIISRTLSENVVDIEYYEIEKSSDDIFSCNPVQLSTASLNQELSLRITGEDTDKGIAYTIYCNEEEFSSLEHGNKVFYAAYQHILQFRSAKSNYPVHITDIDLPLAAFRISNPAQLQTIHYLNYKQKIEDKFNVSGS